MPDNRIAKKLEDVLSPVDSVRMKFARQISGATSAGTRARVSGDLVAAFHIHLHEQPATPKASGQHAIQRRDRNHRLGACGVAGPIRNQRRGRTGRAVQRQDPRRVAQSHRKHFCPVLPTIRDEIPKQALQIVVLRFEGDDGFSVLQRDAGVVAEIGADVDESTCGSDFTISAVSSTSNVPVRINA
jgi:hypothetical protein